ncbi:MAG: site-specific integrase [Candidatus Thioglobus sp.]|jgi:integrase
MAAIQKIKNKKGFSYRVIIRNKGLKTITKTFPRRQLASQFIHKIESDRQTRASYSASNDNILFKELVSEYLNNDYQGSRVEQQKSRTKHWVDILGDRKIVDISTSDISDGINKLPSTLSNATKNRYKAVVSVVFSYACRQYGLAQNPVKNIRSLPENNARIRFLLNDERSRLFEACRSSQWRKLYLLVLLAITTGARRGELLSLEWNDIDFDRNLAHIKTTKNGEPKVLPLTEDVMIELEKFKAQEPVLVFNSEIVTDKPFCFNNQWKRVLKEAEIEGFRFHDLRHTCASYLAQSGASLLEIADVLGHKQIQMTKRYAHLCIDHKQKLINSVLGNMTG